jgi:anti-sigma B factor antagonist
LGAATAIVSIAGDADVEVAPELKRRLDAVADSGAQAIVIDLSETTLLDSTVLGVLLRTGKRLRATGAELRLVVARPAIRRIFEITLIDRVLPLHGTVEEALAALARERSSQGSGNGHGPQRERA